MNLLQDANKTIRKVASVLALSSSLLGAELPKDSNVDQNSPTGLPKTTPNPQVIFDQIKAGTRSISEVCADLRQLGDKSPSFVVKVIIESSIGAEYKIGLCKAVLSDKGALPLCRLVAARLSKDAAADINDLELATKIGDEFKTLIFSTIQEEGMPVEIRNQFIKLLGEKNKVGSRATIVALYELFTQNPLPLFLSEKSSQSYALAALGRGGVKAIEEQCLAHLSPSSRNSELRSGAAVALGHLGSVRGLPLLLAIAQDSQELPPTRVNALIALERVDVPEVDQVVRSIVKELTSPKPMSPEYSELARTTLTVLAQRGGDKETADALFALTLAEGTSPTIRWESILTLVGLDDERALATLVSVFNAKQSLEDKVAIAGQIGKLRGKDAEKIQASIISSPETFSPKVTGAVIGELSTPPAKELADALLKNFKAVGTLAPLNKLAELRDPRIFQVLREGITNTNLAPAVRAELARMAFRLDVPKIAESIALLVAEPKLSISVRNDMIVEAINLSHREERSSPSLPGRMAFRDIIREEKNKATEKLLLPLVVKHFKDLSTISNKWESLVLMSDFQRALGASAAESFFGSSFAPSKTLGERRLSAVLFARAGDSRGLGVLKEWAIKDDSLIPWNAISRLHTREARAFLFNEAQHGEYRRRNPGLMALVEEYKTKESIALLGQAFMDDAVAERDPAIRSQMWDYGKALKKCAQFDIEAPFRFRPRTLVELIKGRLKNTPDERPLAIVVLPKPASDHNGAFLRAELVVRPLLDAGRCVRLFEIEKDQDSTGSGTPGLIEALIQGAFLDTKSPKAADEILIGAHGSPFGIAFGTMDPRFTPLQNNKLALDLGDLPKLLNSPAKHALKDKGRVGVIACSTGKTSEIDNSKVTLAAVSTILRDLWPQAGVCVAPNDAVEIMPLNMEGFTMWGKNEYRY